MVIVVISGLRGEKEKGFKGTPEVKEMSAEFTTDQRGSVKTR